MQTSLSTELVESLSVRLRTSAAAARDADDAADAERERRDRLVVDAVREGLPYRQIVELTGLSRTRILAIVARDPQLAGLAGSFD